MKRELSGRGPLALKRETVRTLTASGLKGAVGGTVYVVGQTVVNCPAVVNYVPVETEISLPAGAGCMFNGGVNPAINEALW